MDARLFTRTKSMIVCGAAASYCAMAVFHSSGSASGVSGTCQASQTHIHQLCCIFLTSSVRIQSFPTSTISALALEPYQRIIYATRRCEAAHTLIRMRRLWIIRRVPCFADALLPHVPNVTLGPTSFPSIPGVHRNPYKITHEAWQQTPCRGTCKSWISES